MDGDSDLLSAIVRADLPYFTDELLERLVSKEDLQNCRLAHWRWRLLLDNRASAAVERRERHHASFWTSPAAGSTQKRRKLDLGPVRRAENRSGELVLDDFSYVGTAGDELFIFVGQRHSQTILVYRGSRFDCRMELPLHSSFLSDYPEELDFDDDGNHRQWVVRLIHRIQEHYVVFAFWGSRQERFPYYYILVFDRERKFLRYLRHNLSWKRTTRPDDFLFRVDRDELWGYRGVKGNVELFRVDPTRESVSPMGGGKRLNLPKYTMTGTPLAKARISKNYIFYTYLEPDSRGIERKKSALTDIFTNQWYFVGNRGQGVRTFLHFGDHHTACVSAESRTEVQITVRDWRPSAAGREFSVDFPIPQSVRSSRRGLDLGQVRCCLSGPDRRSVALLCHYCDAAFTDGFGAVAVDLGDGKMSAMGSVHFDEGVAGEVAFAGGRILLIERRSRSGEFLELLSLDIASSSPAQVLSSSANGDLRVRLRSGEFDSVVTDEAAANVAYALRGSMKDQSMESNKNKFVLEDVELLVMERS